MPVEYIVGVKKGLSEDDYSKAKKHITDSGAKVKDTYDRDGIMPGFVVELDDDAVHALDATPHVEFVEKNGTVKTQ